MTVDLPTRHPSQGERIGDSAGDTRFVDAWGHRPALDGLRSIAVYLVLLFHAEVGWASGGFVGVDLFFVLSGFLVTNVLLVEWDRHQRIRLGRFYARRVRRLMPAAGVVIVATAAVFVLVAPVSERLRMVSDARASLLYVANWHFLSESTDYFAEADAPSPFLHFWTLGIEEQFYVAFPLVVIGLMAIAKRGRPWVLPAGFAALFAGSLFLQWYWSARDATHAYYGTDTRLYQLMAGALLASTAMWWRRRATHGQTWGGAMAIAGLAGLIVVATSALDVSPSLRGVLATAGSVVVLAGLEVRRDGPLPAMLGRPTITYLGRISYGTYLWHWPVILVLERSMTIGPLSTVLLAAALSTSLAALSAQLLEQPIRRAAVLDRVPLAVIASGLAVVVLAAVTVVPTTLRSERAPVIANDADPPPSEAARGVEGFDAPVPEGFDWEAIAADFAPAVDCTVADPEQCVVVPGGETGVMLIGDSHVDMYSPMFQRLARRHGFELSVSGATGCGWQDGLVNVVSSADRCERRQEGRYDEIVPALDPDVVVLISRGFGPELRREDRDAATDPAMADLSMDELVAETSTATVERLVADGRRVIIIEPVPNPPDDRNMVDCLSGAARVGDCAFTAPEDEPYEPVYRYLAMRSDDVVTVDLDRLVCPDAPICMPIVDGEPVRKDNNHITATFLRRRAGIVWDEIRATGVLDDLAVE